MDVIYYIYNIIIIVMKIELKNIIINKYEKIRSIDFGLCHNFFIILNY